MFPHGRTSKTVPHPLVLVKEGYSRDRHTEWFRTRVASRAKHQVGRRIRSPVFSANERVQDGVRPRAARRCRRYEPEGVALISRGAAILAGCVEIAGAVGDEAGLGIRSVASICREPGHNGFRPESAAVRRGLTRKRSLLHTPGLRRLYRKDFLRGQAALDPTVRPHRRESRRRIGGSPHTSRDSPGRMAVRLQKPCRSRPGNNRKSIRPTRLCRKGGRRGRWRARQGARHRPLRR